MKRRLEWTNDERKSTQANAKALTTIFADGIALKTEHNSSNATSYSEKEVMMLTRAFESFFVELRKHPNLNGGSRITTGIGNALIKDTNSNETLAFNVVIDLEDTSIHNDHNVDSDDDSIYSDEEVPYKELQDKYSLLYTKWVGNVKLYQEL
ncbi:hypothetical protein M9H77_36120 [Catharanthus roseus]|uniref:Uncharacterized protein n=1 Tax=Catharanthus roseus TaxID=4058 RepID=A0ACB9ZRS1_CATRO|nr:hypothetical protein M9H77_36120 [Catharanthus roseus]